MKDSLSLHKMHNGALFDFLHGRKIQQLKSSHQKQIQDISKIFFFFFFNGDSAVKTAEVIKHIGTDILYKSTGLLFKDVLYLFMMCAF